MRIGFLSTRFSGTDGVSLEVEKMVTVLQRMGHDSCFCAGELGGYAAGGALLPLLHFRHPAVAAINKLAFEKPAERSRASVLEQIETVAADIEPELRAFLRDQKVDILNVQNAFAIPMNLPLALALARVIAQTGIPTIAHHHDFYWERARYQDHDLFEFLDSYFPPDLPSIHHVTINSIGRRRLQERRGIGSTLAPNVHDFATPPAGLDAYSEDLRQRLGLSPDALFVLQPTRIVPRKGIEMAIELVHLLDLPDKHLTISHSAGDEGLSYWRWLQREAQVMKVSLSLIDDIVAPERQQKEGRKVYSLWDVYPHADLVTYPSIYEGFGNALLEAVYFRRLVVVNRYPVYNADIEPLGFEFIELDGFVDEAAARQTEALLADSARVEAMVEKNYAIAREHFSLETLQQIFEEILSSF